MADMKALLKRVVELVMPDLRSYYRVVRKARVVKTWASGGEYFADVQPLRNDDSIDESEPVISRVEIPVIWAGPNRGIVCPPAVGSFCDLEYYDGDPDYPRISNFRWHGNGAPTAALGDFVIQSVTGTHIKIDAAKNIIFVTPAGLNEEAGGNKTSSITGNKDEQVGGNWTIQVTGIATIQAAQINLSGNIALTGDLAVTGSISATETIMDDTGNSNHHSHA
jgi:uncharacterized protein involved in type VI secretion and phage assembly